MGFRHLDRVRLSVPVVIKIHTGQLEVNRGTAFETGSQTAAASTFQPSKDVKELYMYIYINIEL